MDRSHKQTLPMSEHLFKGVGLRVDSIKSCIEIKLRQKQSYKIVQLNFTYPSTFTAHHTKLSPWPLITLHKTTNNKINFQLIALLRNKLSRDLSSHSTLASTRHISEIQTVKFYRVYCQFIVTMGDPCSQTSLIGCKVWQPSRKTYKKSLWC